MFSNEVNTFGIFNTETKELFQFEKYEDAYKGYLMLLQNEISKSHLIPKDWYLVYINSGHIIQFEQFKWDCHILPGIDLNELDKFEKPTNW